LYDDHRSNCTHVHGSTQSDHSACIVHLSPPSQSTGPWRTPHWLTQLPETHSLVVTTLQAFLETTPLDHNVSYHYDQMVQTMRDRLRQLHLDHIQRAKAPLRALEVELRVALADMVQHPICTVMADKFRDIQARLVAYHDAQRQFKSESSVQRHLEEAARCTRYHLRLPTTKPLYRSTIDCMRDASGTLQETDAGVAKALQEFYAALYDADLDPSPQPLDHFLEPLVPNKLPEPLALAMAASILASELYLAIM